MDIEWKEGKIINTPLEGQMKNSYIDYAMSVIVTRALPDVRDGLKPVHRRILYAMSEAGMLPGKAYKKSARIVGDVLGKYHPHGDIAVYESAVRMAQDFSTRYPLVDGHGNFGSVDGDSAAAMRYTEMRMAKITVEMLRDIDKNTVDFMPNYDGSLQEPLVLPSRIPNLLVNGSYGIAVGMATNIPPHNLSEVVDGLSAMIDDPDITIDGLMKYIKGPDFPTAGIIQGVKGIEDTYRTGRGSITVRAKTEIENCLKRHPGIALYQADGQHPTEAGSYLAACVMYCTLFGKSPLGLPAKLSLKGVRLCSLPADRAKILQTVARDTCKQLFSSSAGSRPGTAGP